MGFFRLWDNFVKCNKEELSSVGSDWIYHKTPGDKAAFERVQMTEYIAECGKYWEEGGLQQFSPIFCIINTHMLLIMLK